MNIRQFPLPAFLLAAGLAACSSVPPAQPSQPAAGAPPHRVIVISLDGAGALAFHDLYKQGLLKEGGFERFFREGVVADALIPVDPSLTSTSHISLATGYPPSATGIVANQFHPAGAPATERVSGFDAAIGAETLWEAARRQGRRVGVLAWPGADSKDARRTADWGMAYNEAPERLPEIYIFAREDWEPLPAGAERQDLTSYSPPLVDDVTLGEKEGLYNLQFFALDSTDDDKVNYDSVMAESASGSARRTQVLLHAGKWGQLVWPHTERPAASRIKLLSLKPDLSEARLFIDGVFLTLAYPGETAEPLARKGLYWPGPPSSFALASAWQGRPGINVDTWLEQAELMTTFMGEVLSMAAARQDWDLLMGYIPVIDQAGHRLLLLDERQPGYSQQRRDELTQARTRVWQMVDTELRKLMNGIDLTHTTLLVVGDHGMTPVHTAIDPSVPLAALGLGPAAYVIGDGGVAHVHVENAQAAVLADLARRYAEWEVKGEKPIEKILTRQEAAQLGIDHPNSGDLVLFAREGYLFRPLTEGKASGPAPVYGAHGHLNTHPDMHAVYMAIGAGVKPGPGGTVRATEVAPRVSAWLGIDPPRPSGQK